MVNLHGWQRTRCHSAKFEHRAGSIRPRSWPDEPSAQKSTSRRGRRGSHELSASQAGSLSHPPSEGLDLEFLLTFANGEVPQGENPFFAASMISVSWGRKSNRGLRKLKFAHRGSWGCHILHWSWQAPGLAYQTPARQVDNPLELLPEGHNQKSDS